MRSRTLFRLLFALAVGAGALTACEPTTGPTDPIPRPDFPSVMDVEDLQVPEHAVGSGLDSLDIRR